MKMLRILFTLLCFAWLAGCGSSSSNQVTQPPVLRSIQVTPAAPSIAAGLTQQFKATGTYSDESTKDLTSSATWSSSATNTATVASTGMATSKAAGSATITASYSGISGSTTLNVTAATIVSLAVSPSDPSIALGATVQLKATGTYTDGSTQDLTNTASWTSSNTGAAIVSGSGMVTSKGQGSATITATSSQISGSAAVTVTAPALASLAVSPLTASIAPGTTTQFEAIGTFTDGTAQNLTSSALWSSSNPTVAGINVNGAMGLAKGLAAGTSTISASSGNFSASATLTVTSATLNSIATTPQNASLPLGTLQQFTATGTFSDGSTQNITGTVTWSSSGSSIASITVSGLVTAENLGTVTITAASGSITSSTSVSVNAADLSSLAIVPASLTIAETTSDQLSAIGTFTDGSTRNLTTQAAWTSSNPAVATVSSNWGLVKGLSPGTSTISATVGSMTGTAAITVTDATVVAISVTPVDHTIAPGSNLGFTATGSFSDASTQNITSNVTWTSDNPAVATAASGGVVTAIAAGTANISATLNAVSGSAPLNVVPVTLTAIAVSPASALLAPGSLLGYSATGTYSDGSTQIISTAVTWTSSATAVATITSFGEATGESPGTTTINAQLGSVSGTAVLVVGSSQLTALQVAPSSAAVAEETGTQFSATGVFANGSTQDLTNSAMWTSSTASVATVSDATGSKGLASGLVPGAATITALFAGQVGMAYLTVTNASLTSITITPNPASIGLGSSQQFIATGNFSDGTTENLTSQVSWTSSSVNVAAISASGLAATAASGTTTITASMNEVYGMAVLTVY